MVPSHTVLLVSHQSESREYWSKTRGLVKDKRFYMDNKSLVKRSIVPALFENYYQLIEIKILPGLFDR